MEVVCLARSTLITAIFALLILNNVSNAKLAITQMKKGNAILAHKSTQNALSVIAKVSAFNVQVASMRPYKVTVKLA